MREFFEVADTDSFMKLAENVNAVIRVDPYVFINFYGLIFYLNLGRLEKKDVRRIIQGLRNKLVVVKRMDIRDSIYAFLTEKTEETRQTTA